MPVTPDEDELAAAMAYAVEHLDEVIDIDALADRVHLSRRTFDRKFHAATGLSRLRRLLHQRVLRAQQLLEHSDLPVDGVARRVGFASTVSLRAPFRRAVGVSPQDYRATFRPTALAGIDR